MLSLPLVSQFPLGPSRYQGSRLLRPGGRLSRLLRPGGRLSRLLRPGGRPTCQSHLTPPLTCRSHLTPPLTCRSHLTPPLTCRSHLMPPLTCQSHFTSPLTLQNLKWRTQQLSCQSLITPQRSTQCPFTSLQSCPPCPGGLLSHWPHMDLALRSLPWFHLRSTALLDYALSDASGSRSLGGGSVMNLVATHYISCTTVQLHITHGLHLPSCTALTHSHPPLHQSHSCHYSLISLDCLTTPAPHSHTHTHLSSTLTCTHREVLFLPRLTFLSVIHPASWYLCVWPRTARPWNSEPVPVTPTSAWYCLRLCPASDIPVFACRPLPVWFCLCLINLLLQMDPHAFDQSLQQYFRSLGDTDPSHKIICIWEFRKPPLILLNVCLLLFRHMQRGVLWGSRPCPFSKFKQPSLNS